MALNVQTLVYIHSPWAYLLARPDNLTGMTEEQLRLAQRIGVLDAGVEFAWTGGGGQDDPGVQFVIGLGKWTTEEDPTRKYLVEPCATGVWREWWRRSAEGGSAFSAGFLAHILTALPEYTSRDPEILEWAQQGTLWRVPSGLVANGRIHAMGLGIDRDPDLASQYYTLALHYDSISSGYTWIEFADFILSGRAVGSAEMALEMYLKAAEVMIGPGTVRYAREVMHSTLSSEAKAHVLELLKRDAFAPDKGVSSVARFTLAMWLQQHLSVMNAPYDVMELIEQSADMGYSPAQLAVAWDAFRRGEPDLAWFWAMVALASPVDWQRPCFETTGGTFRLDPLLHVEREAQQLLDTLGVTPTDDTKEALRRCLRNRQKDCLKEVRNLTALDDSLGVPAE